MLSSLSDRIVGVMPNGGGERVSLRRWLATPIILIAGLSAAFLALLPGAIYKKQWQGEVQSSQQAVEATLKSRERELQRLARDVVHWNGAALKDLLRGGADPGKADADLSQHLADGHDIAITLVLRGDDRVAYVAIGGRAASDIVTDGLGEDLLKLAEQARSSPADAVPVAVLPLRGGFHRVAATRLVLAGGADPRAVLILARHIDVDMRALLGRNPGLENLRLVVPDGSMQDASLALLGPRGAATAVLTWSLPWRVPGVLPLIAALLVIVAGLSWAVLARIDAVTQKTVRDNADLVDSKRRVSAILDGSFDGIVTVDAGGRIRSANGAAHRIFGHEAGWLVGKEFLRLVQNGGALRWSDWLHAQGAAAGEESGIRLIGRRPDGTSRLIHLRVSEIAESDGRNDLLLFRDVSEGIAATHAANRLPAAMLVIDDCGRLLFANDSAFRLMTRDEGVALDYGTVMIDQPAGRTTLAQAIAVVAPADGRTPVLAKLPRRGRAPLAAMVRSLRERDCEEGADASVVLIRDPEQTWDVPAAYLADFFELTGAEARVAAALVRGQSLQEMAASFGLSVNTIRNQLQQVYRKTGATRQSELVSLVLAATSFAATEGVEIAAQDLAQAEAGLPASEAVIRVAPAAAAKESDSGKNPDRILPRTPQTDISGDLTTA